ncbi:MAG: hypothetical protein S0880_20430 [Actinomycetota bacterium]|nr:hypothetical protein [Actinomycetota bacterium]
MTDEPRDDRRRTDRGPTLAALCGVAYVVLAAIEGLDALVVPRRGDPAAVITAYLADHRGLVLVTSLCGALALPAYVLAAVGLVRALGGPDRPGVAPHARTAAVALVAAVVGAACAACGIAARTAAVRFAHDGDASAATTLYRWSLDARVAGGAAIAVFLFAIGALGLREGGGPRSLAWSSLVAGAAVTVATLLDAAVVAGVGDGMAEGVAGGRWSLVALAGSVLWMLVASVWLLLSSIPAVRRDAPPVIAARLIAGAVAVAAGVSGVALLCFPHSTPEFFSWGLAPPSVATLIGGFYVASAVVFGLGATSSWPDLRWLMAAVVALAAPVFVATVVHLDVFDLGRLQSWVWIALFGAFPIAATVVLLVGPRHPRPVLAAPDTVGRRLALVEAAVLVVAALAVTIEPVGATDVVPFAMPAFAGRVVGGWLLLLATFAAVVALAARRSTPAALALVVFPAGALVGAARTAAHLVPTGRAVVYVGSTIALLVVGLIAWRAPANRAGEGSGAPAARAAVVTGGTAGAAR